MVKINTLSASLFLLGIATLTLAGCTKSDYSDGGSSTPPPPPAGGGGASQPGAKATPTAQQSKTVAAPSAPQ
jgi:hypothetical protein